MTKRLNESQIVVMLEEAEAGISISELFSKHGIGKQHILQMAE